VAVGRPAPGARAVLAEAELSRDIVAVESTAGAAPADPAPTRRSARAGARRVFWLGLLAFFLLPAAWAVATPYDGAYDEHDHIVRAAGIVRGQIIAPPTDDGQNGRYQTVPKSLVPPNFECLRTGIEPATCLGTAPEDRTGTRVHTRAGHYNPFYYAVVGWPLLPFPDMTGVILVRLLTSLLVAAMFAWGLVTIWPLRRRRLMLLALLMVAAPTTACLTGLVNPNGVEIVGSALLWISMTLLLSRDRAEDAEDAEAFGFGGDAWTRRLVRTAVVAGAVLALTRPIGVIIAGGIVLLTVVALGRRSELSALLRRRDVRVGVAVVVGAALLAFGWSALAQVGTLGTESKPDPSPATEILRIIISFKFDYWIRQTVGIFGYATVSLPVWVVFGWGLVLGLLVLGGVIAAPRRQALMMLAIPTACILGGLVVDMIMVRKIGFFMQGRYFMPLWMGMFFLAARAVPHGWLTRAGLQRLYGVFLGIFGIGMTWGLYLTVKRYEYGDQKLAEFPRGWRPPLTEGGTFLLITGASLFMAWLALRYVSWGWRVRPAVADGPQPSDPAEPAEPDTGGRANGTAAEPSAPTRPVGTATERR
jgi:hypothetical protein